MLNIVVVSPMPSVRAKTATTLRPRCLRRERLPKRMSRAMDDIMRREREGTGGGICSSVRRGLRLARDRGFTPLPLRHISLMANSPNQNVPVWDAIDRRGPSFVRLATGVEADVCVIGLGGSGLACIAELLACGG